MTSTPVPPIERHPWPPYAPPGARVLLMGTFPPGEHRWSMPFYYPNRTNDFWYMMGLLFYGDRYALCNADRKGFNLQAIKALLDDKGIALHDTARAVRRLKGNASDKYLEIVEPVPLYQILADMPHCRVIATTGEKATQTAAAIMDVEPPAMGAHTVAPDGLQLWRMPSTSRAYPLSLDKKAAYYATLFRAAGVDMST